MAFFTKQTDTTSVKEFGGTSGGSKYIGTSGMFPVNLIAPFLNQGNEQASSIDLFVDYEGQKQVIYGNMAFTNKDGSENKIGTGKFNKLVVIQNLVEVNDPIDGVLPIGKKGTSKDCAIIEDLADMDIIVQITMKYGIWNNNITEKTEIRSFFRGSDNASAEEITAADKGDDVEFGKQFTALSEGADFIQYGDGLDAERVKEWISAKRPKGTGAGTSATATKKPSFGKPKFGN